MTDKYEQYRVSAVGKLTPPFEPSCSVVCDIFNVNPYCNPNERLKLCHDAMNGKNINIETNKFMDMVNRLEKVIALDAFDRIGLLEIKLEVK